MERTREGVILHQSHFTSGQWLRHEGKEKFDSDGGGKLGELNARGMAKGLGESEGNPHRTPERMGTVEFSEKRGVTVWPRKGEKRIAFSAGLAGGGAGKESAIV